MQRLNSSFSVQRESDCVGVLNELTACKHVCVRGEHQWWDNTDCRNDWRKLIICHQGQHCFVFSAHKNSINSILTEPLNCWLLSCCKCVGVCLQSASAIQTVPNHLQTHFLDETRSGKEAQNRKRSASREFKVLFFCSLCLEGPSLLVYPSSRLIMPTAHTPILCYIR